MYQLPGRYVYSGPYGSTVSVKVLRTCLIYNMRLRNKVAISKRK